jgi:hypothetical protein
VLRLLWFGVLNSLSGLSSVNKCVGKSTWKIHTYTYMCLFRLRSTVSKAWCKCYSVGTAGVASVQRKVLPVVKDVGGAFQWTGTAQYPPLCPSSPVKHQSTVSPSDKGMCDMSSSRHCSDTPLLKHLGGVQVGDNHIKTPGWGTGRISSCVVRQAQITAIHQICPTNIVYFRHVHGDIHTKLLYIFRQQEYLTV